MECLASPTGNSEDIIGGPKL